jgi:DNA invertase Pin-like site-specific DNA recombinase
LAASPAARLLNSKRPAANRLTVGIMAMVAEEEGRMISERTKAALAAARRRGVQLGGYNKDPKLTAKARKAGHEANRAKAAARATDLAPAIAELQAAGATSLRDIAAGLNERGIPTARGGTWTATQVMRVMERNEPNRPLELNAAAA